MENPMLLGALGSLVATMFWALLTVLFSTNLKPWLYRLLLGSLGVGVDQVYRGQTEAESDIADAARVASEVRVLGMRGRSLLDGGFLNFLITDPPFRRVNLLLADPDAPAEYNPVSMRAREIDLVDPSESEDRYKQEGREALSSFYRWNHNRACTLRVHQFPAVFRLVATEHAMFLTFYPAVGRGKQNILFRLPATSPFYAMLGRYFDKVWSDFRTREPSEYEAKSGH